ncbi:XkdX family protein [Paenibacillus thiaminolyticus]|jgi:hypothetical protein|nr:XkdX family protein [Paenibacillus thiaminolyticus]NGP57798.1 XkdX family protein [Paenibacillus thiaminolyticus]
MTFWKLAFECKWIDAEGLRAAVKTESNPFGEISPEEYKQITGIDFN